MKRKQGFTIVELLVVIVVLGIVTGVTTVAYAGMQRNAEYTRIRVAVDTYAKALRYQRVADGRTLAGVEWACLGRQQDYPAEDGFALGQCSNGGANNYWNTRVMDALLPHLSRIPDPIYKTRTDVYGGRVRGLIYDEESGHTAPNGTIVYYVDANQNCPIGRWRGELTADSKFCEYVVVYDQ